MLWRVSANRSDSAPTTTSSRPRRRSASRPQVAGPDQLRLTWDIAPGTYLYSHMLELALEDGSEVAIGSFERPAGEIKKDSILPDGSVGDVEVYHDRVDLTLPLLRGSSEPTEVTLVAKYQGCAEIGICYPPQTQRVTLSLPEALVTAASADGRSGGPDGRCDAGKRTGRLWTTRSRSRTVLPPSSPTAVSGW
jgi:thiol:disulfide interchange protein